MTREREEQTPEELRVWAETLVVGVLRGLAHGARSPHNEIATRELRKRGVALPPALDKRYARTVEERQADVARLVAAGGIQGGSAEWGPGVAGAHREAAGDCKPARKATTKEAQASMETRS